MWVLFMRTDERSTLRGVGRLEGGRSALPDPATAYLCCTRRRARQIVRSRSRRPGRDRRWIEPLHDEPDAERQLPDELRDDHEAPHHGAWLDDPEQDADETSEEHGAGDEP